jgi:translocation and assembly module TamB
MSRALKIVGGVLLGLVLLAMLAFLGITTTDFGRERIRRVAVGILQENVHGRVTVDRIEGKLAGRFALAGVAIADSQGNPFLTAERITAQLGLRTLFSKQVMISELKLERPTVRLTKSRDGTWNFERIFPRSPDTPKDSTTGFGDWVAARRVEIVDGTIEVRQPWLPDADLAGTERDSAIAAALNGQGKMRIERVGSGYDRTMEFRSIDAQLPTVVIAHPDSAGMSLDVATLDMVAAPLKRDTIDVRDLKTRVRIGDDSLSMENVALQLAESRLTGGLVYLLEAQRIEADLEGNVAFADVRPFYPPLPESGGGTLEARIVYSDTGASDYTVRNASLRTGGAQVEGDFGLAIADDSSGFHDTSIRFTNIPTSLIQRFAPKLDVPTPGALSGRVTVAGPMSAMRLTADATFDGVRHPPFRLIARGGLGAGATMQARDLRVTVERFPVSLVREVNATFPVGGVVNATATINGSSASTLVADVNILHEENRERSRIVGVARVTPSDPMRFDAEVRLEPLSLEIARRFMPNADVRGVVRGTARVSGTPTELEAHTTLDVASGTAQIEAKLNRSTATPTYSATVTLAKVDVQRVMRTLPHTSLNGEVVVEGAGFEPETMNARVRARLRDFQIDSADVSDAEVRAEVTNGLLELDTMHVRAPFGSVVAAGSFGLRAGRDGKLTYRASLDSLGGIRRWIASGDTAAIRARPRYRARMARLAEGADSVRIAGRMESREVAEGAMREVSPRRRRPRERAAEPAAIAADSIAGSVRLTGDVTGGISRFTARGTALTQGIVWGGSTVGRGRIDLAWADVRTPNAVLTATASLDTLQVAGFAFDSTTIRGRYTPAGGDAEIAIFPGDTSVYRVNAEYALRPEEREIHVRDLSFRFDSTTWAATGPSVINWKAGGITIDSLELRDGARGRIFVDGRLPAESPGNLVVAIDSLRVAPWLTLLQSDVPADAVLSMDVRLTGSMRVPTLRGAVSLARTTYNMVPFPDVRAELTYDQRRLTVSGALTRATGSRLANFSGAVPIDLALAGPVPNRFPDQPLTFDLEGDSIPLSPLGELTEALTVVEGFARGKVAVRGTVKAPRFEGDLDVRLGALGIAANGIILRNTATHLRMAGDTVRIDSLVAHSGGVIRGRGHIVVADFARPVLDLHVESNDARVLDNEMGELWADSRLRVVGALDAMDIAGNVTITRGVVFIPDPENRKLINTGDPALFAVIDTATAQELDVAPSTMKNLRLNVNVDVGRDTWARSREANVEIYGSIAIRRDSTNEKPVLRGALFAERGDYTVYGRRFTVTRGSVRFTGQETLNPALQIMATHEVRQAGRAPFDVRVIVGGTLERPNLTLESEAQPTLSQSDLISFLAFGQSSTSLLQFQSSGLEGGGQAGSSLAGNVGRLASRQLASVALGALVDEAKQDLTRVARADVVNITPADLPADLSLTGAGTVLRGTEIQLGKYLDRRTFLLAQIRPTLAIPGASLERALGQKFRLRTSFETRFQPQRPTLTSGLKPETIQVLGALLSLSLRW